MSALIEGSALSKVYGLSDRRAATLLDTPEKIAAAGGTLAVSDVSFDVAEGELFVLMGLSGSGKSTLLRMVNRLVEPTAGTLRIDGTDITGMSADELRTLRNQRVSMVFQHFALFPHRSVRQNAAYGLEVRGIPARERLERADEALRRVGLGDRGDASPNALSGGQRQRVGLARALATEADILLMDEPFSALDPLIRRDMQDLLLDLQSQMQRTIVFVTHDLNEAMRIGSRIMVLRDGGVQQCGTGPEILAAPANTYVEEFIADVDRSRVLTASAVMRPAEAGSGEILAQLAVLTGQTVDEYHAVPPDRPVADFLHLAGHPTVPLVVVDDGRLVGVVPPAELFSALALPRGGPRA